MLAEIASHLAVNILADLGSDVYPDDPIRSIQQGQGQPVEQYPALMILPGPIRPRYMEIGADDMDRTYEWRLYGQAPAATMAAAYTAAETQAKRLEAWIITNNGLGGLTDGTETVYESTPGPWEVEIQGGGGQWFGYWAIPILIQTTI
jgi:hypothetical protein